MQRRLGMAGEQKGSSIRPKQTQARLMMPKPCDFRRSRCRFDLPAPIDKGFTSIVFLHPQRLFEALHLWIIQKCIKGMKMNQLEALKQFTTVVADTGDFHQLAQFQPQDATTNPSLILKAVQKPEYAPLMRATVTQFKGKPLDEIMDRILVRFGCEILNTIPGRVSTEVDARLSFDTEATVTRAERLIELYQAAGIHTERVLIKMAATWEGIEAARILEQRGIHTNLTLLFSFCQAVACGQAKVQLISPFVGRIYDWYKKQAGAQWDEAAMAGPNDPGVLSVRKIYDYYKHFDITTEVMGASFRNIGQIQALAGCDLLTIAPELLTQLAATDASLTRALDPANAKTRSQERVLYEQATFRFALNEDAMATEKLAEGIRAFTVDTLKLETLMQQVAA